MECNRDEAVRARDIAEQKYAVQEYLAAKKLVQKALQLFPGLEGLAHMLPVMEVHSVAQLKLGGTEMDWYGILQVEPTADDSTIKRQYRKLALALHPDKNKTMGAEAAFKLIGEAMGILSDKNKRTLHDMRRIAKGKPIPARVSAEANVQSFQTTYHPAPVPTYHHPNPVHQPNNSAQFPPNSTFWTCCARCRMQYQYLRTYENYQLKCHKCSEVFVARDMNSSTAGNGAYGWTPFTEAHRQDFTFNKPTVGNPFNGGTAAGNGFMNGAGMGPFVNMNTFSNKPGSNTAFFSSAAAAAAAQSKVAAAAAAAAATAASSAGPPNNLAAEVVQQTYQKVKRERVEAEKENKRKEKELRKKERDEKMKEKRRRDEEEAKEAMIRLITKRKLNSAREEKRRADAKPARRHRRKKRGGSDHENEDDLVDEDAVSDHVAPGDLQTPLPRRRSARAKRNITSYKVDSDDDSDLESSSPASKRAKVDTEAGEGDAIVDEANGKEPMQRENGGKGPKVSGDDTDQKRGSSINGGEESGRTANLSERSKDGQSTAFVGKSEGTGRESHVFESSAVSPKMKSGKTSQRADSGSNGRGVGWEADPEGAKISKSGDLRDEKSPSKSPRTLRMRVKSPEPVKGSPFSQTPKEGKGSEAKVESTRRRNRALSPTPSAASQSTEREEDDPEDEEDEDENDIEDEEEEEEHIDVPDPDFHDFDSVRTERDIGVGQVWAIYDDQDGMPRFYGRISRASPKPFKVSLHWLELASEELKTWSSSTGLSLTCGEFRMGKTAVIDQINIFSHIMLNRAPKGLLKVYPKKDDVWAVYKDWDPEQKFGPEKVKKLHGEGSTYRYEMVEILSDFCKEQGVKTVKLTKVKGYKTVFFKQKEQEAIQIFKSSEMARFSHCVPAERMKEMDFVNLGIPEGAVELDPASTPMDLIIGSSDQSR